MGERWVGGRCGGREGGPRGGENKKKKTLMAMLSENNDKNKLALAKN